MSAIFILTDVHDDIEVLLIIWGHISSILESGKISLVLNFNRPYIPSDI